MKAQIIRAPKLMRLPADGILEVCTCGYVVTSEQDRELHMQEHMLSFVADYDLMFRRFNSVDEVH